MTGVITLKKFLLSAITLALGVSAFSLSTFYNTFTTTYKVEKDSALGKQACQICHVNKRGGKQLNPYGKDVQAALHAAGVKKITAEILHKVDKLDSTKSGMTNLEKIRAGKNPGTN